MNTDVILLNPSYLYAPFEATALKDDPHYLGLPSDEFLYPPLGLLTIGGALKRAGFDVIGIDSNTEPSTIKELAKRCEGAKVVGIALLVANLRSTYDLVQAMKGRGYKIVLGGAQPTVDPAVVAKMGADYGIAGEGEVAFVQLCRALIHGDGKPEDIPGIIIPTGPEEVFSRVPELIEDPSECIPDRSLLRKGVYKLPFAGHTEVALSSRGCPYECTFCYVSADSAGRVPNTMRWASIDSVVRDMVDASKRWRPNYIEMVDETFTISKKYTLELCEALIEANFDTPWGAKTRIDLVDEELLEALSRTGMRKIGFGLESGVYDHRRAMKKDFSNADAKKVFQTAARLGMETGCTIIFGHPDETLEEMQMSVDFAKEIDVTYAEFHLMVLMPGTPLFDRAVREGKTTSDVFDRYMRAEVSYPEYTPIGLTPQQLRDFHRHAVRSFYLRPRYMLSTMRRLVHHPQAIGQHLKTAHSLFKRSRPDRPIWSIGRSRVSN